jgi:hypothetical protein
VATFVRVASLPLRVDGYRLEGRRREVSSGFTRHTTLVRLCGQGEEGVGEDVVYDAQEQLRFERAGRGLPLAGTTTLGDFPARLDTLALFAAPPAQPDFERYRRWAFESAALDLALRQAGLSLPAALDRTPRPVRFVVSLRLGDPPTAEPVLRWLSVDPSLRFKLDPTSDWPDALVDALARTGAVAVLDLKGAYHGTSVDQPADPVLYRRVIDAFPDAWIEDPALTGQTEPILAPHRHRVTWDAPVHGWADVERLPWAPRCLNVKPSRFGRLATLLEFYDCCDRHGISLYGGGQFELDTGRGQIQALASLFHPDAPNDVAPAGYNDPRARRGLPRSPLSPHLPRTGFGWAE